MELIKVKNKRYDTGVGIWRHNQETNFKNGVSYHKLLGPCPICGKSTFNYGGGWRCNGSYCFNSETNPIPNLGKEPFWWETNLNVKKDGNAWIAYFDGFINIQESDCEFGDTPKEAIYKLCLKYPKILN